MRTAHAPVGRPCAQKPVHSPDLPASSAFREHSSHFSHVQLRSRLYCARYDTYSRPYTGIPHQLASVRAMETGAQLTYLHRGSIRPADHFRVPHHGHTSLQPYCAGFRSKQLDRSTYPGRTPVGRARRAHPLTPCPLFLPLRELFSCLYHARIGSILHRDHPDSCLKRYTALRG